MKLIRDIQNALNNGSLQLSVYPANDGKFMIDLTDPTKLTSNQLSGVAILCNKDGHDRLIPLTYEEHCAWRDENIARAAKNMQQ